MFSVILLGCVGLFLLGNFLLQSISYAFRRFQKKEFDEEFGKSRSWLLYRSFYRFFFPENEYEGLFFSVTSASTLSIFLFLIGFVFYLQQFELSKLNEFIIFVSFFFLTFLLDYCARILGVKYSKHVIGFFSLFAAPFLYLAFPITFIFLKLFPSTIGLISQELSHQPMTRDEIMDYVVHESSNHAFDMHDRNLIESVLMFRERIAREVMVPRVDVFSVSADTPIKDVAPLLQEEGYSRIPVYRHTVDNIVGLLMYKDVLKKYIEYERSGNDPMILQTPIESIQKPIIHIPETKRLSNLLQEFRKKQVHLAIVVDEYGGTEGVVTIEDILEEIVGDISDEYDEEEKLFHSTADGGWIVDARMNILDVEDELNIKIPQEADYDTIGGYIFHVAGAIPLKGFIIHHDQFNMEILSSNDRCVESVLISPINK